MSARAEQGCRGLRGRRANQRARVAVGFPLISDVCRLRLMHRGDLVTFNLLVAAQTFSARSLVDPLPRR
jgi:hypothetical protein